MKRTLLLMVLCFLLNQVTVFAADEPLEVKPDAEQASEEEEQILEILELLQNYDLLAEIEILSTMEEER